MNIDSITFVGIQYQFGSLEVGNYKLYHSDINPNNLLSDQLFTEQDFYNGVKIYKENFPQSLIFVIENNLPYSFEIEKV